ncbi:hypothetical protein EMIT048CA2_190049 [Pseudomonas chlororaphis]
MVLSLSKTTGIEWKLHKIDLSSTNAWD